MLAYEEYGRVYQIEYDPYDDGAYTGSLMVSAKREGASSPMLKSIKELSKDLVKGQIKFIIENLTEEENRIIRFMIAKTFDGNWWGSSASKFFTK